MLSPARTSFAVVFTSAYVWPLGRFRTAITRVSCAFAQSIGAEVSVLALAWATVRLWHSPTTGLPVAVAGVVPPAYAGPVRVRARAAPAAARIRVRPEIVMWSS